MYENIYFLRNSVAIAAFSLVCSPLVKAQEIAHGSIFLQELEMRDNDAPSDPSKSNGHTNVKAVVMIIQPGHGYL